MYWLDKLKEFKKESKKTYKDISNITNIPLTTVEKLFSGRTSEPKFTMLVSIVNALGHRIEELIPNSFSPTPAEYDMMKILRTLDMEGYERVKSIIKSEHERVIAQESRYERYSSIYFDFPVSAGTGEHLDDTTASIVTLSNMPPSGTDYVLRISGDSMEPRFTNDDFVYVQRKNTLCLGDIGIFTVCGSVYMKEYTQNGLHSLNPKYGLIPPSEDIRVLGKVLGKVQGDIKISN